MKKIIEYFVLSPFIIIMFFCASCNKSEYQKVSIKLLDSIGSIQDKNAKKESNYFLAQYRKSEDADQFMNIPFINRNSIPSSIETFNENGSFQTVELTDLHDVIANRLGTVWKYINDDSIFYVHAFHDPALLIFTNSTGKKHKEWILPALINRNKQVSLTNNSISNPMLYNPVSKEFIFCIHNQFYTANDSAQFNKMEHRVLCTLSEDSVHITKYFGQIPSAHQHLFLGYNSNMKSTLYKDRVLLSYSQSDSIYTYQNGEIHKSYYAKANNFDGYKEPFDYRKSSDRTYLRASKGTGDYYADLITGENYTLRVVVRKKASVKLDEKGENINDHLEWGLVILDKDLNYKGEVDMTGRRCDFNTIFPYGDNKFIIRAHGFTKYKYFIYEIQY